MLARSSHLLVGVDFPDAAKANTRKRADQRRCQIRWVFDVATLSSLFITLSWFDLTLLFHLDSEGEDEHEDWPFNELNYLDNTQTIVHFAKSDLHIHRRNRQFSFAVSISWHKHESSEWSSWINFRDTCNILNWWMLNCIALLIVMWIGYTI